MATTKKYPHRWRVYLTEEQRKHVEENADAAGMSVSRYLRMIATGRHVASKMDAKILNELRRIGGLLKVGMLKGENTAPALNELKSTMQQLMQQE